MEQEHATVCRPFAVLAALLALPAACIPQSALARRTVPDTWRYEMVQTWGRDTPGAKQHTRRAQMWVKGKNWRREEQNMITIVSGGWIYYLEKDKKRGIKQPVSQKPGGAVNSPSPAEAARQARRHGKRVGTGMLAGRPMTVYQIDRNLRVWVGADGLVYRTEGRRPEYRGLFAWEMHNLRRNIPIPDSLFRPPASYKVHPAVMTPIEPPKARRP